MGNNNSYENIVKEQKIYYEKRKNHSEVSKMRQQHGLFGQMSKNQERRKIRREQYALRAGHPSPIKYNHKPKPKF